ncbi:MAG: GxxExxY protein [Saprospiraceae bacterium]|nr:GxxExxY protein [Saprospiraceae bacterium]
MKNQNQTSPYPEKLPEEIEVIGKCIVNAAFKIHNSLGPGLLEKVYESCLEYELRKVGLEVKRQIYVPICYDNLIFDEGLRLDLLVGDKVIVEIKAQEKVNELWKAQVISHLKLTGLSLGYLINFHSSLMKYGIKRIRNG